MNDLCYSIEERKGLATLVGRPGTGKTTLLNNLTKVFDAKIRGLLVSDASLGGGSLLRQLMGELGLPAVDDQTLPLVLRSYLQNWLLLGMTLVLLVDEAQSLTVEQFEEVRYLTNLELQGKKLIAIILAGQPSLEARLSAPQFEALRQRVGVRTYLEPLSFEHASAYIQWRLQAAGATNWGLFGIAAMRAVHERTKGIPRLINLVCDRALLIAYANDSTVVEPSAVEQAANELGIDEGISTSAREPEVGSPAGNSDVSVATDDVAVRLAVLEKKIDIILDAMASAGVLSVEDEDEDEEAERPPRSTTSDTSPERRVAKFRRRRQTS
jgi:general secretion pathway protein A